MKNIKLASLFLMIFLAACSKKDETNANNSKTAMELITNGKWYISAYTSSVPIDWNGNGVLVTDLFTSMPSCEKDNYLVFMSNLQILFNAGATKCNVNDSQEDIEAWKFLNNEKEIEIDGEMYFIVELTATAMVLKEKDSQTTSGVSHVNTISLRH